MNTWIMNILKKKTMIGDLRKNMSILTLNNFYDGEK